MSPGEQYQVVVGSLRLLGASTLDQAGEIVSTFGYAFRLVPPLERAGFIGPSGVTALHQLHAWLARIDASSLESLDFWANARGLAVQALHALGAEVWAPSLRQIAWVRAEE